MEVAEEANSVSFDISQKGRCLAPTTNTHKKRPIGLSLVAVIEVLSRQRTYLPCEEWSPPKAVVARASRRRRPKFTQLELSQSPWGLPRDGARRAASRLYLDTRRDRGGGQSSPAKTPYRSPRYRKGNKRTPNSPRCLSARGCNNGYMSASRTQPSLTSGPPGGSGGKAASALAPSGSFRLKTSPESDMALV